MTSSKSIHFISKSIESFLNLNSYLRHGIINNVNIINLAIDLLETGESDPSINEILANSSSKLINRLIQSKELEGILELVSKKQESENIQEIIETSIRKYFSQCEFIFDLREDFLVIPIYSSIFNSIFRNAITIRHAQVITISIGRIKNHPSLIITDDGQIIPEEIEQAINDTGVQFDPLVHDNDYFDVFLVKEILKSIEECEFTLKNNIPAGSSYIITLAGK